uniref:Uncharacterized protein n=1 Tax=Physcomitrium patens TaxID=3218 RepID=A0A2K1K4A9_PHYPA|nr:hypothetical protein PHYPA_013091 [Physcomitrium patens]
MRTTHPSHLVEIVICSFCIENLLATRSYIVCTSLVFCQASTGISNSEGVNATTRTWFPRVHQGLLHTVFALSLYFATCVEEHTSPERRLPF